MTAAALLIGAALLPASARAQQHAARPTPAGCDSCDAEGDALQRELAREQEALQRAESRLEAEREATMAGGADSTGSAQEALARAAGEVRRAQERYRETLGRVMRREMARARSESEHAMHTWMMARARSAPAGWLGVTFSGSVQEIEQNGKTMLRFSDYPRIEAVEPDSPAERAGIAAQDRLVAIGGRDVTQGIEPFRVLLKPGARLPITLRRNGSTRTVTVLVTRRPEREWADWGFTAPPAPPASPAPPAFPTPAPAAPASGVPGDETPAPAMVAPSPMVPLPRVSTDPVFGMRLDVLGPGISPIAGAELRQVGELRDYFGVRDGVLVLRVVPGTPAARAGLRGGDVIRRANGRKIDTPLALAHVMNAARQKAVTLDIVRRKKAEKVVLRWEDR